MQEEGDILESQLPPLLQGVLALWRTGRDLRQVYPNATFYRHRATLFDALGVDIASPPPERPAASNSNQLLDEKRWDPEPLDGYGWESAELPYWKSD